MAMLADKARRMPRSGIREVMDLAWSLPDPVIGLHVGEPSFATPEHVRDGARRALERGETRYVENAGVPALRAAIAEKIQARNGLRAEPEQIVVSAGGMQALYVGLSATVAAFCCVSGTSSRSNTRWEKYDTTASAMTTHTMITPASRQ